MLHSSPLSQTRRASSLAPTSAVPSKDGSSSSHRRETAPRTFPVHMYASDEYDRLDGEGSTRVSDPLVAFIACATFFATMIGTLGTLVLALGYALGWI